RMRDELRFRVAHLELDELPLRELLVHDAEPRPEDEVASGLLAHPRAQVPIRGENDRRFRREAPHNLLRVRRSADDVGKRFHARGAIDVADDLVTWVLLEPRGEL